MTDLESGLRRSLLIWFRSLIARLLNTVLMPRRNSRFSGGVTPQVRQGLASLPV